MLEMCALPEEEHHSAWVAQRLPAGEVFVAANEFRIWTIPDEPSTNFRFSESLHDALQVIGWWNPTDGAVD
ncbi:MAG: dipeptidase [Actinomycetota bacterium]|nr:dipeptidase [Actinomycetota bacterium]